MQGFTGATNIIMLYGYMVPNPRAWLPAWIPIPEASAFDGRHHILVCRLRWESADGRVTIAHIGVVQDGGTIRTALGWCFASTPRNDYLSGYIIHDVLCVEAAAIQTHAKELLAAGDPAGQSTMRLAKEQRLYADRTLREIILYIGDTSPGKLRRRAHRRAPRIYLAVRAGAILSGLG